MTQTALITGTSRGLGLALARELARQGWQLIITARSEQALRKVSEELSALTTVNAIAGDVTDAAHLQELAAVAGAFSGLDAVINNASTLGISPRPALLDYPPQELETVYRTNVIAPLAVIQGVSESLKTGARILNVTSDAAVEPYAGWGGYGSSKAGLEHLTAILAEENPEWRVYSVDPGDMRTQMHQEAFPGEDISDRPLPETSVPGFIQLLMGDYPSGRYQVHNIPNQQTIGVKELRLVLTTPNFEETVQYYRDGLNLSIEDKWDMTENGRGILLNAGRATLEILDGQHAGFIDELEVGRPAAGPVRIAFEVEKLDPAAEGLLAQGAEALSPPRVVPWGHRNQRLQAPDTLQVTLFERYESEEETEISAEVF